jgi:hypothetical protein
VKGQHGDQDIMKSCIVSVMRLIWLQQFRISRLRWAGHIVRMQDNIPCKKVTLDKLEGRR